MLEAILSGVAASLGISLLPRSVVGKLQREGLLREIPATYRYMTTDFITRRDSFISSALGAFMEMIAPAEELAMERPAAGDGVGADRVEGGRMP